MVDILFPFFQELTDDAKIVRRGFHMDCVPDSLDDVHPGGWAPGSHGLGQISEFGIQPAGQE
jgi:hypothetical protein